MRYCIYMHVSSDYIGRFCALGEEKVLMFRYVLMISCGLMPPDYPAYHALMQLLLILLRV